MKEYKVIKEFGSAKKGDVLEFNEETELYSFDINEENNSRYMAMDEECAESFVESGMLLCSDDENKWETKLKRVHSAIDTLLAQYKKDNEDMLEEYSIGSIPTCVKVEAETVYHNLTTVLNKIKSIINE